jgi:hypothetical protein
MTGGGNRTRSRDTSRAASGERNEALLLTDSFDGRDVALDHDIDVHSIPGVIALAYTHDFVDRDEVATLMRALKRETVLFVIEAIRPGCHRLWTFPPRQTPNLFRVGRRRRRRSLKPHLVRDR